MGYHYCRAVLANAADPKKIPSEGRTSSDDLLVPNSNAASRIMTTGPDLPANAARSGGGASEGERKEAESSERSCTVKLDGHRRVCDVTYLGNEPAEPRNIRRIV